VADEVAEEAVGRLGPEALEGRHDPAEVDGVALLDGARADEAAAALGRVRLALVRRVDRQACALRL
jgi:hypothetical protein